MAKSKKAQKDYIIDWSFGGETIVKATSASEAEEIFINDLDHEKVLKDALKTDLEGLDIHDVSEKKIS